MNTYCRRALNQLKLALTTTVEIMDTLEESDLGNRPLPKQAFHRGIAGAHRADLQSRPVDCRRSDKGRDGSVSTPLFLTGV